MAECDLILLSTEGGTMDIFGPLGVFIPSLIASWRRLGVVIVRWRGFESVSDILDYGAVRSTEYTSLYVVYCTPNSGATLEMCCIFPTLYVDNEANLASTGYEVPVSICCT